MDVREKLVELIVDAMPSCYSDIFATQIADHLIANGVTFATDNNVGSKWISVKDRLPEGDKVVMCYKAGRGIRFGTLLDATYADGVQAFMDRDRTFAFGVTHWMPLPQPPKGE